MLLKKHHPLSPLHNRIIIAWIVTGIIAWSYSKMFGPECLSFFFCQGLIASWIVDNTNYIEHYGLRRKEVAPGEYERVGWLHAWDTPDMLTNVMLFKIQRHPDHHTNAGRPYQILRTFKDAPTLPTGYAGCIVLSWFPPLWRYVMDWRVELVEEQQKELELKGTVRGKKFIFPDGCQAVASHDDEVDVYILGNKGKDSHGNEVDSMMGATSVKPKNDLGGLKRVDDEREHVAVRWTLFLALIYMTMVGGGTAMYKAYPGRLPDIYETRETMPAETYEASHQTKVEGSHQKLKEEI